MAKTLSTAETTALAKKIAAGKEDPDNDRSQLCRTDIIDLLKKLKVAHAANAKASALAKMLHTECLRIFSKPKATSKAGAGKGKRKAAADPFAPASDDEKEEEGEKSEEEPCPLVAKYRARYGHKTKGQRGYIRGTHTTRGGIEYELSSSDSESERPEPTKGGSGRKQTGMFNDENASPVKVRSQKKARATVNDVWMDATIKLAENLSSNTPSSNLTHLLPREARSLQFHAVF
jgi:hypothetical protein